jgi:hypothetical protein
VRAFSAFERPSRWEYIGLVGLVLSFVLFGCLVELRSTFLSRRMGDLSCYLRPAWAVRTGQDIYQLRDDSGWHYNYPPLLAILLVPLADPPAGADRAGMVPYSVSVAIWYVLSVLCLWLGVHLLARALEEQSLDPQVRSQPVGCRRWWALRILPVLACLVPIGHSLMRGQVNLLVLMCFCAMMAALLRGRSGQAGWWLAWPICIKVYPAFLLLYPLVRRDGRFLAGAATGLLVGLVFFPMAVFGPSRTRDYYVEYFQVTLAPGLGIGQDSSRSKELTTVTATDSQSLLATLHNTLHLDRYTRPANASARVRQTAYLLGGLMTAATLWAVRRKPRLTGPDVPLLQGALILNMLLLCPVCHLHYFCMALPLVMGLVAWAWEHGAAFPFSWCLLALLTANVIVNAVPNFRGMELVRDLGLAMYMALLLWGAAILLLPRKRFGPSGSNLPAAPSLQPRRAVA